MNITNSEYFTFNVDNSLLLVGQTGTGKSVLEDKYIERLIKAYTPDKLKFVLLDMTTVDFAQVRDNNSAYVLEDVSGDADKGLDVLQQMAEKAEERAAKNVTEPLIVVCIEECDMAMVDYERFNKLLTRLNQVAAAANMKVIFSTSRPSPKVLSKELLTSFDLILAGKLTDTAYAFLGVEQPPTHEPFDFIVTHHSTDNS
jgi:DNA segregation ATPase FtsK/SpoIIIE-like protein